MRSNERQRTEAGTALVAKLFRGFADPSRLAIVQALAEDERLTVGEIVDRSALSQSNASNHLACLRECGLVTAEQRGRHVFYELADERVHELLYLAESLMGDIGLNIFACTRYGSLKGE